MMTDTDVPAAIDALQTRYIAALDDRNMEAWLATFSKDPDASYTCTTAESEEAGLPLALILDDTYTRLQDRVTYVTQIWAGTFADYRTRHFIQRTAARPASGNQYDVETNFMVACTPVETGRTELFMTGMYFDRVVVDSNNALFLAKKAVMDSSMVERFMAYPL